MKSRSIHILVAAAAMMAVNSFAAAAGNEKYDLGKREFESKCALCHGKSGKGDGGVTDLLKKAPPDLTLLAKKNGGVFPFERISAVIDGREVVKGHGDRDMPIWGTAYKEETVRAAEHFTEVPYDMEMYVRTRILALIDYLNRIQAK
jgi:mono/diheme cytochrome c family protein